MTITTVKVASQIPLARPNQDALAVDRLPAKLTCHSHNDYWQRMPLKSALSSGCASIEVDVWAYRGELYIGHSLADIQPNQTLSQVYLDQMQYIFDKNAGESRSIDYFTPGEDGHSKNTSIVLLVDFKSSANGAWDILVHSLDKLRQNGLLSFFHHGQLVKRSITVVATGKTVFKLVQGYNTYRDIFFDAPLEDLTCEQYNMTNSYYASASFKKAIGAMKGKSLSLAQLSKVRAQVATAHRCGLKVRYWNTPAWPLDRRNRIWDVLITEGVDMLNVDNLDGALDTVSISG